MNHQLCASISALNPEIFCTQTTIETIHNLTDSYMSRSNNLDDVIYEPTGPFLLTDATFYVTSAPQRSDTIKQTFISHATVHLHAEPKRLVQKWHRTDSASEPCSVHNLVTHFVSPQLIAYIAHRFSLEFQV